MDTGHQRKEREGLLSIQKQNIKDVGKTLMISGGILSLGDEKPSKLTRKSWLIPPMVMIEISI